MAKAIMDYETKTVELLYGYKDSDGIIHKEAEIREMTGVDEEDVQRPENRSNIGRVVTTILKNCVVRIGTYEKSEVKPTQWENIMKDLFIGDRDLLLMKIREFTYGEDIEIPFRCPACRQEGKHIMEWDEVKIEPLKCDPYAVEFELKKGVPDANGERVKHGLLRMPKGIDQELLDSIAKKNMGQANTSLITRCVTSLGDIKLSSNTFKQMVGPDREKIVDTIADNAFGPNFRVEIDCPSCGEHLELGAHPVNFL